MTFSQLSIVLFRFLFCFSLPFLLLNFLCSWPRLVLETLGPLPPDRKCFRMINGVLVERTIKDVKPALETNSEGLKKVLEELLKQYKKQQDEMDKWKVCRWCSWTKSCISLNVSPIRRRTIYKSCITSHKHTRLKPSSHQDVG